MSFDFDHAISAPFRMQPGLRRLAEGATQLSPSLRPGQGAGPHLREKLAVLWAYPWQALLCAPGFDATPALAALAKHASQEHPQAFSLQDECWCAPWLGWSLDAQDQPLSTGNTGWPEIGVFLAQIPKPWRRAALLSLTFEEDFALVDAATGTLPWLAVALPSMWAPEEKVGRSFAAVHAPVADNRLLVSAADHLVKLVTGTQRWERFVWTLTGHPRLHGHPLRVASERWANGLSDDSLVAQTWWRTERQTFIPVPETSAASPQAVFTIQVKVSPMASALAQPHHAALVHDALASMSEAVLAYRGLTRVRAPLLRWLARQAAG
jgi:hypothetical protein